MSLKEFFKKYGFTIGFVFEICAASFIMVFSIFKCGLIFFILGIILFLIGTVFMLYNTFKKNTISIESNQNIKTVESKDSIIENKKIQKLEKENKRIQKLEKENKRLNKLIKSNKKKLNLTVEKYCNLAGYLLLCISVLLFLIYLISGIVNFINSNAGGDALISEALMTIAMLQILEAFEFIILGIIFSAILFALTKIIKILLNKKYESEKNNDDQTK
ncbi:MAG: hypothetical protein PHR96_01970 [Clostridia bacterium]|nr:hypothetical protein [Clostridia bacterium]